MGFLDTFFKKETRKEEVENLETRNTNQESLAELLTSNQGITTVNEETIQTIPTVVSCLELITGTIAQLPVYLYKEGKDGSIEKIDGDYRTFLLNSEANSNLSAFNFKKSITKDYLLHGGSYTYLEKKGNDIVGLYPLRAKGVSYRKFIDKKGYKYSFEIDYSNEATTNTFKPYELLSVLKNTSDGSTGKGIIEQGKKIFELSLNENEYSSNILNKGALPIGILETENRLTKEMAIRLKESWERLYSGVKNAGKTVVLEEGLKYKPLSLSPSDLNLNESKKISAEEICKLFNVPSSLVIGEKGYGDIEQDNLRFTKYCLSSILANLEIEFDRSLLLEEEKMNGYYFRFDTEEMLRLTEVERYTSIEKGMKAGVISINEARKKLDFEPLETDYMMFSLGNVFFDRNTKEFVVPNTGAGMNNGKNNIMQSATEDDFEDDEKEEEEPIQEKNEEIQEKEPIKNKKKGKKFKKRE